MTNSRVTFVLVLLVASLLDVLAAQLLKQSDLSTPARLAIAMMPLPGDIALIVLALCWIRRLDDFQRKLHLEAVAAAFLSTGVAVFIYGYLQTARLAGDLNAGMVWIFMLVFYAIGYAIAAKHYR